MDKQIELAADNLVNRLLDDLPSGGLGPMVQKAGWNDLLELANIAQFNVAPFGEVDFWALMGMEGLSMEDSDNQTPRFFDFVMGLRRQVISFFKRSGDDIQFEPDSVLRAQWQKFAAEATSS